jgi:TIR domain-containing protein/uncharacterized protein DUF4384
MALLDAGHDVFVSYAREDECKAAAITEFLERQGIRCWRDRGDLRLTEPYDARIMQAIRDARVVLWLASNSSLRSDYVQYEISSAVARDKPIGPVFLEPLDRSLLGPPFDLAAMRVHGIEYFSDRVEESLAQLLDDLRPFARARRRGWLSIAAGVALVTLLLIASVVWRGARGLDTPPPAGPLPPRVASLPAASVLQLVYNTAPPAPPPAYTRPALQLAIVARRDGEAALRALNDGDTLATEVDEYAITMRPLSPGWAYVFQVDASGRVDPLFPRLPSAPHSSGANPVETGQVIRMPPADEGVVFYLDATPGVEHVYAVLSATRWPELEVAFESRASPDGRRLASRVEDPNELRNRGIGGTRPATLPPRVGEATPLAADEFAASGRLLVVERWIKHVGAQ